MPKKKVTWFVYKKVNLVLIVVVAALVGSVGTAQLTGTQAAAYPGYFFPDRDNKYTSYPYNPRYMGDPVSYAAVYKKGNKNPIAKLTCWHVDVEPTYQYYDSGNTVLESKAKAQTTPIYSETFAPAPPSGQVITVTLGTKGTGPATCESQFFDGSTLKSTISFRSL